MIFSHIHLFLFFVVTALINIVTTTHLYSILLIGFTYYIFSNILESKQYAKLVWSIFTFLVFEINFGFPIFSILLFSYFIYIVVIPYFSANLSFNHNNYLVSILIYYSLFAILVSFQDTFTFDLFFKLFYNYIIDIFLIMVLL
jgi:hypothetical protein